MNTEIISTSAGLPKVTPYQQRKNRLKLAKFLETRVRDEQFCMEFYVDNLTKKSSCKTVGCALGWAVISGHIPGVGWSEQRDLSEVDIFPAYNKRLYSWGAIGRHFYGDTAFEDVFRSVELVLKKASRQEVVKALREI